MNYEVFYDGEFLREEEGFEDYDEVIEDAWATVQELMESWENDCELELFTVNVNGFEYDGNELKALCKEI